MADKPPPDPELVTRILVLAIGAAGPAEDVHAWHGKLSAVIPEIVTVLGEGSREHEQVTRMMNCPILSGEFLGYRLHDTNHRAEVTIKCGERDPESMWSERTDTPLGASQLRILKSLPKGCHVRVWKYTRQAQDKPNVRVRDMLHIQRVDADLTESRQPEGPGAPPPERPTPVAESPAEAAPAGDASVGQHSGVVLDYAGAIERLKGGQRVALARWAHETMQVSSLYDESLTADQKSTILAHCELIAQGMA